MTGMKDTQLTTCTTARAQRGGVLVVLVVLALIVSSAGVT